LTIIDNFFFETRIRFATKIVKNQRLYFAFALNEMQQAAFEGAKQNEILRTTMRMIWNDNIDNLIQQLLRAPTCACSRELGLERQFRQHCARIVRRSRSFERSEIRTSSGARGIKKQLARGDSY
jgi:hypothetical protein